MNKGPLLQPQDFINLQKIVRRATPEGFEEMQVIVGLDAKLSIVLQQIQRAQMEHAAEQAAQKEPGQNGNHVPAGN